MERRDALKNLGLSIGGITMSSTVVGLLQSCSGKSNLSWNPEIFDSQEAELITKTLEVILPKTEDIPGATELNLTQFIDGYIKHVSGSKEQKSIKKLAEKYLSTTKATLGKKNVSDMTLDDIDSRLAYYLKADKSQIDQWSNEDSDDASNYNFLNSLRSRGVSAFKMSEYIGEKVLAYSPIPGQQIGCVDLNEATGGKAWSI